MIVRLVRQRAVCEEEEYTKLQKGDLGMGIEGYSRSRNVSRAQLSFESDLR